MEIFLILLIVGGCISVTIFFSLNVVVADADLEKNVILFYSNFPTDVA